MTPGRCPDPRRTRRPTLIRHRRSLSPTRAEHTGGSAPVRLPGAGPSASACGSNGSARPARQSPVCSSAASGPRLRPHSGGPVPSALAQDEVMVAVVPPGRQRARSGAGVAAPCGEAPRVRGAASCGRGRGAPTHRDGDGTRVRGAGAGRPGAWDRCRHDPVLPGQRHEGTPGGDPGRRRCPRRGEGPRVSGADSSTLRCGSSAGCCRWSRSRAGSRCRWRCRPRRRRGRGRTGRRRSIRPS